jgi:hypothetical protein
MPMIRTVDMPAVAPRRGANGQAAGRRVQPAAAGVTPPAAVQGPPPDHAAGPGPSGPPHRDAVTAVHEAIDFARALVADGGHSTAGLTMLRVEVGAVAREMRALREEVAALRVDCDRVRWDVVRLGQFTRGNLVDRLAAKFAEIDAAVARLSAGLRTRPDPSECDVAQMRAGCGADFGPQSPGEGGDCPPPPGPGCFGR